MDLPFTRAALSLAILACLSAGARSDAATADDPAAAQRELDAVVVTASPLREDSETLLAPVAVLAGAELDDQRGQTLGETVARLPGVQTSFFGPAVGRPIVRGLEGARVAVLSGGLSSMDVATVSADHAVSIDPFLADQIEVLKGPATLLYGSGAIGGAVNVVDGRIPQVVPEALSGRLELAADSVADARQGAFRLDGGDGNLAFHVDAFGRDSRDYEIDGPAILEAEPGEHPDGVVENSASRTRGGAFGLSWIGSAGHLGVALSTYRSDYGIPGEHEHDHDEDGAMAKALDAEGVRIELEQVRLDVDGAWNAPFAGVERLQFKLGGNDYRHFEIEPDGAIGSRFDNDEIDGRLELVHQPIGAFRGALGLSVLDRDFAAAGEEAFVPPSQTRNLGLFLVEKAEFAAWTVEFGGRYERSRISAGPLIAEDEGGDGAAAPKTTRFEIGPDGVHARSRFALASLSAAARWRLGASGWQLGLLLDRAQRAPVAEELFANGPHLATRLFELGNAGLDRETANQAELELRYEGERTHLHASVYYNRFDDYIFLQPSDFSVDGLQAAEWRQQDVRFRGFELGIDHAFARTDAGDFGVDLLADKVRARTVDPLQCFCLPTYELPRIAPARLGAGLNWNRDAWRARVGALHYFEPDNDFEAELADSSFTLVSAVLAWSLPLAGGDGELYLRGDNLLDRRARLNTSFLREVAPLPGRNVVLGWRWRW